MQIALGISNISYQHLCSAVKQKITKRKKKIFCMIRDKVDVGDVIEMKINHSFYPPQIVICLMTSVFFALI